jgi:hypothetical protein
MQCTDTYQIQVVSGGTKYLFKSGIAIAHAEFNKREVLFTRKLDLNFRKKQVNCYTGSTAEIWTLRKVDQKYLEGSGMCWRRMEKISWTDCVRYKEVLHRVKKERNILHTIKRRKHNWIGHILRRNCILKHVIEGKIDGRIEVIG